MLKDFGVKDVKVQEIFSLDEDSLSMLPLVYYFLSTQMTMLNPSVSQCTV